ncbi:hypothetical protein [Mycobacterium sp.]|uniref:hypothetical protein n=1 Tax=Mycobacterium sp. TaxID=1785 RepID=UPI002BC1F79B|nr:hypothetical protein [Mycobacterium sp.]HKP43950.1 hypothetical protein [Mycobacterium sp.]
MTAAVVTAAVSAADEKVCAVKELTGIDSDFGAGSVAGCESMSTLTSTASTLLSGGDGVAACACVWDDLLVSAGATGSVFSSALVSVDSPVVELAWAPPVLTTTPGGACVVVDPVDVDTVVEPDGGSVVVDAVSLADFADSDTGVLVDDSADGVCDEDESADDVSGVSAHAIPYPCPVTTATPTPSATAKPPTRPTYAAALMHIAYAQAPEAVSI